MVMAGFDPAHVKHYFPSLLAWRSAWPVAGRTPRGRAHAIDLQADLMRYTVDTIAGLAFGAEVNTLESDDDVIQQHLDKIFPALFKRILAPIADLALPAARRPTVDWRAASPRSNAAVAGLHRAGARAHAGGPRRCAQHPRNLLEAMIAAADEPGSGIDDKQVAGNVLTMLLAGEDTTANTIAWMIHLLWRHPAALARATDEVRRVCGERGEPTLEQMAQLDYRRSLRARDHAAQAGGAAAAAAGAARHRRSATCRFRPARSSSACCAATASSDSHVPRAAAFEPERWLVEGGPCAAGRVRPSALRCPSVPARASARGATWRCWR